MHRSRALGWLTCLIVVVALITMGCGGGDGDGGGTPTPAGSATLTGKIIAADNTATAVRDAVITVQGAGRSGTSNASGAFTITGLPSGSYIVTVNAPNSEQYGTASARVTLSDNQTTTVNLALLPLGVAAPERVLVDPASATVDLNGQLAFRAQVVGPNGQVYDGYEPTWVVDGGVGQITSDGVFTAETVGSGQIRAFAGSAERTVPVTVVAPRPPQISSFRVNPQTIPASGGEIFISAAIKDGDGVRVADVTVEILPAGGAAIELPVVVSNPATAVLCPGTTDCYTDASFRASFQVPANDNTPSGDGVQAQESYSVILRAADRSGAASQSQFVEFVVQGIDAPPAKPAI